MARKKSATDDKKTNNKKTRDTGLPRKKRRPCPFCLEKIDDMDYKDSKLRRFITDRGKIVPRRNTSVCSKHQRIVKNAIKRARTIGLIPYSID